MHVAKRGLTWGEALKCFSASSVLTFLFHSSRTVGKASNLLVGRYSIQDYGFERSHRPDMPSADVPIAAAAISYDAEPEKHLLGCHNFLLSPSGIFGGMAFHFVSFMTLPMRDEEPMAILTTLWALESYARTQLDSNMDCNLLSAYQGIRKEV